METITAFVSETAKLCLEITNSGAGVTGQAPTIIIRRLSDNKYWTGTVWQVGISTPAMTEYNNTNFPGLYSYDFTIPATADVYLVEYINTGAYTLNEFNRLIGRKKPMDETAITRTSISPASVTYGEKMEEIYGATAGASQLDNTGSSSCVKNSIKNYAETDVIKEMDILKPVGTVNTQTLDTNAMSGKKTSV